jgi:capsule polysaccharide export protein KpsC/LpsZ
VCERRTAIRTLDELVCATLILFPRYISPQTGEFCEVEQTLAELKEEQERYFNDRWYRYSINIKGYLLPRARKSIRAILRLFKLS